MGLGRYHSPYGSCTGGSEADEAYARDFIDGIKYKMRFELRVAQSKWSILKNLLEEMKCLDVRGDYKMVLLLVFLFWDVSSIRASLAASMGLGYWFYEYCGVGHPIVKEEAKYPTYLCLRAWERGNRRETNDQTTNLFIIGRYHIDYRTVETIAWEP
ncbi:hypothetical protein GIB67_021013 [Kingdonia uniflora]|uniref:Uncharacterized protein n=1 Tax=Kingdonia uniflora TaxID=39325 RepID=A0A7J7N762_9MAGN|nr:hypothetical protein GIB67_021013 [Kingdonia uniflora]